MHSGSLRANIYLGFPGGKEEGTNCTIQQTSPLFTDSQFPQKKKKKGFWEVTKLGFPCRGLIHPFSLSWDAWGKPSPAAWAGGPGPYLAVLASPFLLGAAMLCLPLVPVPSESAFSLRIHLGRSVPRGQAGGSLLQLPQPRVALHKQPSPLRAPSKPPSSNL